MGGDEAVRLLLSLAVAYLVGAIPSALVLGRWTAGIDIRTRGSGNVGATNAWRVLGWRIGLAVFALDIAKGYVAAAFLPQLPVGALPISAELASIFCGGAAILGHVFPVYIGFRGGKGVATAAGVAFAVAPIPTAIGIAVFAVTVFTIGIVSVGSIAAVWAAALSAWLVSPRLDAARPIPVLVLFFVLAGFITVTHRSNIRRLLAGREPPIRRLQIWRRLFRE